MAEKSNITTLLLIGGIGLLAFTLFRQRQQPACPPGTFLSQGVCAPIAPMAPIGEGFTVPSVPKIKTKDLVLLELIRTAPNILNSIIGIFKGGAGGGASLIPLGEIVKPVEQVAGPLIGVNGFLR